MSWINDNEHKFQFWISTIIFFVYKIFNLIRIPFPRSKHVNSSSMPIPTIGDISLGFHDGNNQGSLLRLDTLGALHCTGNVVFIAIDTQNPDMTWLIFLVEDEVTTLFVRGGKHFLHFLQLTIGENPSLPLSQTALLLHLPPISSYIICGFWVFITVNKTFSWHWRYS